MKQFFFFANHITIQNRMGFRIVCIWRREINLDLVVLLDYIIVFFYYFSLVTVVQYDATTKLLTLVPYINFINLFFELQKILHHFPYLFCTKKIVKVIYGMMNVFSMTNPHTSFSRVESNQFYVYWGQTFCIFFIFYCTCLSIRSS